MVEKLRTIAFYLPQFHRVRENDEWWGEGYTEWTAVRKAEPLFDGHEQPRVPLEKNYYDLMDKKTMVWQADLMHRYGIDGMCFYHYYFKDGRKILEKPAENLLRWEDIDMPFCFSWANESWIRSWSKFTEDGVAWSTKFEKHDSAGENRRCGILLEQAYGNEQDWAEHYRYLSPFFHDKRYIKKDGCPVFLFYRPQKIPCLAPMVKVWQKLAEQEGFPGLYIIGTNIDNLSNAETAGLDHVLVQEPQDTFLRFFQGRGDNADGIMNSIDYADFWRTILGKSVPKGCSLGGTVGFDDTPRRGRGGTVIKDRNPFLFYQGMKELFRKAEKNRAPFLFINAWNEWGEGMYLEPDERYGTRFLEAFCAARKETLQSQACLSTDDSANQQNVMKQEIQSLKEKCDKYSGYWHTFDLWMNAYEQDWDVLLHYFQKKNQKRVAFYGYGMLGRHFLSQLRQSGMEPVYAVDQQKIQDAQGLPVYSLADNLPDADVIVVTVLYAFDSISAQLRGKGVKSEIIPLDEILKSAMHRP